MWDLGSLPLWHPNVSPPPPSGVSTALHAQMCKILYSVKYLFLHYFTRAVFTKKKKPTPKNKTKQKKFQKTDMQKKYIYISNQIKNSTVDLITNH